MLHLFAGARMNIMFVRLIHVTVSWFCSFSLLFDTIILPWRYQRLSPRPAQWSEYRNRASPEDFCFPVHRNVVFTLCGSL